MKALFLSILVVIGMGCGNRTSTATAPEELPAEAEKMERTSNVSDLIIKMNTAFTVGDQYTILNAEVTGDILSILVQYGGGCKTHEFKLYSDGAIMKSLPPQMNLTLHHNANQDMCRALITDTLHFNVGAVRSGESGTMIFRLRNHEERIEYNY